MSPFQFQAEIRQAEIYWGLEGRIHGNRPRLSV